LVASQLLALLPKQRALALFRKLRLTQQVQLSLTFPKLSNRMRSQLREPLV
jgi:hypothetical protein